MKNFLKFQLPPLLWIIVIYLLAALPSLRIELKAAPGIDKIEYALVYFILCGLTRRAFHNQELLPLLKRSALLGAFVFTVVFGVLEEYHQNFIPGQTNDPYNLVANVGGALLFVGLSWLLQRQDAKGDEGKGS